MQDHEDGEHATRTDPHHQGEDPETMSQITNPLADGETMTVRAGSVLVAVQCVRPGAAYRLSVRNTDGFEIEALSRSFDNEDTARGIARMTTVLLRGGYTVAELVELAALAQGVAR